MKHITILAVVFCASIGVAGCQNGRSVYLRLEGLPASLEQGVVESVGAVDGVLTIKGRSPQDGFSLKISPWPYPTSPLSNGTFTLHVQTVFMPDGPSSVLSFSDERGLQAVIASKTQ